MKVIDLKAICIDLTTNRKDQIAQDWLDFARFPAIPGYRKGAEEGKRYKVASFKYEPFEIRSYADYTVESASTRIQEPGHTLRPVKSQSWRPHDPVQKVPQKGGFLELFYTQKSFVWQWLFRFPAYHINNTGGILTKKLTIQTGVKPKVKDDWYQGNKSNLDILLEQEILFFAIMRYSEEIFDVGTLL